MTDADPELSPSPNAADPDTASAPRAPRGKPYPGNVITVTFDPARCLHAAECVHGLPQVFDTARRPWITPDAAPADEVAEVIRRCPSGALQYVLVDGTTERPESPTTVHRDGRGRLVLRGDLLITPADCGEPVPETRAMLCGCAASAHQPYCDRSGPCGAEDAS
ncbi:(4Fe-4S)-binding protein [Streptomyces sp. NPDC059009]|uniref:(4Fe-4S)-binding protein n=1 Tax=Streptomyces sp. NPDC059009 TaxID=3346694 RepID=UPI00367E5D2D